MRVAIDMSPTTNAHAHRGVGRYTTRLVRALQGLRDGNEYVTTTKPYTVGADVVHIPYFDLFFLTLPWRKPIPTVVTVHDTIPLVFPEAYPPGVRGFIKLRVQRWSLGDADAVVADSETTKKDVTTYLGVPETKVTRVYLAADPAFSPMPQSKAKQTITDLVIKKPYLLYVGDVNFNKNLAGLLTAFSKVAEQLQMVWVSKAMVENSREAGDLWQQINTLGLKPMIQVLTAPISNTQLQALYTEANWYIQPSWYEGFGLPVLEAMQCGTPVVSSTGGSLTEIVGDAAVTFDPKVQGALTVALEKALAMPESKRLELVAKGLHQASRFSWKQAAEETVKVYRSVVS